MGAPDLLRYLREAGFTVASADGGGIRVAPSATAALHLRAAEDCGVMSWRFQFALTFTPSTLRGNWRDAQRRQPELKHIGGAEADLALSQARCIQAQFVCQRGSLLHTGLL